MRAIVRKKHGMHALPSRGSDEHGLGSESIPPVLRKDSDSLWHALSTVATCLAAIFAGWAAYESNQQAIETGKATRASVWLQVLAEYGEPNMLISMKALRAWQSSDPDSFAIRFGLLLLKPEKTPEETKLVDELDGHRRRVSSFFNKIRVMTEGGVIEEEFVSATWGSGTFTYIEQVLLPIEKAKSDALYAAKSFTQEDHAEAGVIREKMKTFYGRVAHNSLRRLKPLDSN